MDRCKISKWEVVLNYLDRVSLPWPLHDDPPRHMDVTTVLTTDKVITSLSK